MIFKPGDRVRLISLEIDREMEAVNFLKREEKILSIGDVFTVTDVSPTGDWIELAELYYDHPASKFEKVDTVGEEWDKIIDVNAGLRYHYSPTAEKCREAFRDGANWAKSYFESTISQLRAELEQLKKVK